MKNKHLSGDDYESVLSEFAVNSPISKSAKYFHIYHIEYLGKDVDVDRCLVCRILASKPVHAVSWNGGGGDKKNA